ncbi:two-component system regulatory protein YycI [Oceanobacillus jeddahense]|uniref:Two-component system regulatory protein YycI n=1 Tax=Oceanobacillus jeddahense TaxID=1462527 RepID=A0ABY5JSK8_9BACI|nr:two-component system regulatory protein YycI [Oceanobacillus jeddahense]UUI03106.1 two-component system regulatory protein YycI [Oceanobacillus jeddahense]
MQWSHIKTLFILSFLVLNVYLLFQFIGKQQEMNIPELEVTDMNLEEELEQENITISADTDFEVPELSYISSSQKEFSQSEVSDLNDIDEIDAVRSMDNQLLTVEFDSPLEIPEDLERGALSELVSPYVPNASEFSFGTWNHDLNIIVFFQEKENYPIYLNQHAMLTFYVNEDREITHYTQTMIGDTSTQGSTSLNTPKIAIRSLLHNRYLNAEEDVTDVTYGYYSRIEDEGTQVFAPTYKITVDEEKDYYVNAAESFTYPGDYTEYLATMLEDNYLKKLYSMADEDEEITDNLISIIEEKIEPFRSEPE